MITMTNCNEFYEDPSMICSHKYCDEYMAFYYYVPAAMIVYHCMSPAACMARIDSNLIARFFYHT